MAKGLCTIANGVKNLSLNCLAAKIYNGEGQLSAEFSLGNQILPRIKVRKTRFECTQINDNHLPRKKSTVITKEEVSITGE